MITPNNNKIKTQQLIQHHARKKIINRVRRSTGLTN